MLRRRVAFTGRCNMLSELAVYYQPARRPAALQEQLAVNELDEMRRAYAQSAIAEHNELVR